MPHVRTALPRTALPPVLARMCMYRLCTACTACLYRLQAAALDLGLELGKSLKLCEHRAAGAKTRCLRITQKEEKNVRARLNAK